MKFWDEKFKRLVKAQLVSFDLQSGGHYIKTPLMFVSGSFVSVRVEPTLVKFFVSDFGSALEESQLINEEDSFKEIAEGIAKSSGIDFSGIAFSTKATIQQLPGAVATIANASQAAANIVTFKSNNWKCY